MSITKITDPSAVPAALADYQAQNTHLDRLLGNTVQPYPVSGSNVVKGVSFNIGGDMFYCDADTAISGTPSDYVKLVVSGSTATPSFVASLSGVTWNDAYNGYYDVSGNLYVFDSVEAYLIGDLTSPSDLLANMHKRFNPDRLKSKVIIDTWDMDTDTSITVAHGLDFTKIVNVDAIITSNAGTARYMDGYNIGVVQMWIGIIDSTNIGLARTSLGVFDDLAFNAAPLKVTIVYEV